MVSSEHERAAAHCAFLNLSLSISESGRPFLIFSFFFPFYHFANVAFWVKQESDVHCLLALVLPLDCLVCACDGIDLPGMGGTKGRTLASCLASPCSSNPGPSNVSMI